MTEGERPPCAGGAQVAAREHTSLGEEYYRLLLLVQGVSGALGWALHIRDFSGAVMVSVWGWVAVRGGGLCPRREIGLVGTVAALTAAGWVWLSPDLPPVRPSDRLPDWLDQGWISVEMALVVLACVLVFDASWCWFERANRA